MRNAEAFELKSVSRKMALPMTRVIFGEDADE